MFRKSQKPRSAIRAETIDYGVEARKILANFSVAAPLELAWNKHTLVLRLAAQIFQFALGVTAGAFASGSIASPISGSVAIAKWTGSAFSTSGMPSVTALNVWSGGGTGIGSGKTVFMVRLAGQWIILGWDC